MSFMNYIEVKNEIFFDKKTRKSIQILFKFHFETMVLSILGVY
jgi:hypothetical protein